MVNPDNSKIRINFEPDEGDHIPSDQDVKPVKAPKSTKDFKKVYSRTGREGKNDEDALLNGKKSPSKVFSEDVSSAMESPSTEEEESGSVKSIFSEGTQQQPQVKSLKDDEENASAGATLSLFDLSKGSNFKTKDIPPTRAETSSQVESPSNLFRKMSSKESKIAKTETKEAPIFSYVQEQPDLSYVNPLSVQLPTSSLNAVSSQGIEKTQMVRAELQALVAELVKQLYTVEKKGQVDTVLILQNPPLFKDAKIIVSSFDTAKNQLNIAFENLTQQAQKILDLEVNRKSLLGALNQHGYNVQIMMTTTATSENILSTNRSEEGSNKQSQEEDENKQEKRKNR